MFAGHRIARLVKLRRLPERLAPDVLGTRSSNCDTLELCRSLRTAACLEIADSELLRNIVGELAIRVIRAESFELARGPPPGLQIDQRRRCIVLGGHPERRVRHHLSQTREVSHGFLEEAHVPREFALLVYRGGNALLDFVVSLNIVVRCEIAQLIVGLFRRFVIREIELRMGDNGPRCPRQFRLHRRLFADHGLPDRDRQIELVLRKQILGNGRQDRAGFRMLRERVGKLQAAVEVAIMPVGPGLPGDRLLMLAVRENRSIAGLCRTLVRRVLVGRALVFDRGRVEILALEQDFREQEVGVRGIRLAREKRQVLAVVAGGLLVIGALAVALRLGVIVLGQVCQVRLEVCFHLGVLGARVADPEFAVHAVAVDEALLAIENQAGKAAALVRFDNFDLQQRRFGVVRILLDERFVSQRRILVALFFEIQVAEVHIDDPGVVRFTVRAQEIGDASRALHIGKADAEHPERVFDEFLVGPAELRQAILTVLQFDIADFPVQ